MSVCPDVADFLRVVALGLRSIHGHTEGRGCGRIPRQINK